MRIAGKLAVLLALLVLVAPAGNASFCVPPKPPAKPAPPDEVCPACEPKECKKCTASPVYLSLGTYTRDDTDLQIRTTGFSIAVARYYDSGRMVDGPMGIGWTSSLISRIYDAVYAQSATTYLQKAYVVMPHGATYEFTRETNGSYTPPIGRREVLVRNADGTYDLTIANSRTVLHFNTDGTLASIKDEFNNAINYTYDGNGRVQRVADGAGSGRFVDVTWNTSGRISSVTDSAGRTVRYTYDADGNLERVADAVTPTGSYSTRYYYTAGRFKPLLSRITDRWDRVISRIEWDSAERVVSYTDGDFNDANPTASTGEKYRYFYTPNVPPPDGPYTHRIHSLGSKITRYVPGTGLKLYDGATYDAAGQITAVGNEAGRTDYTYDASGRIQTESVYNTYNALLARWTYTYDATFPTKVAKKMPLNSSQWAGIRYEYFPAGSATPGALKAVFRIRKDGVTEDCVGAYTYDANGRMTIATQVPNEPATYHTYNTAGDLTKVRRATVSVDYEYDSLGRVTKRTDEMGKATTYTYDAADRILTVTLPKPSVGSSLNFTTTYTYDQYDPITGLVFVSATDPNGRVTKQGYDALQNLGKTVDSLQNATTYTYQYNLLKTVTDANGNTTTHTYDANRQLASTTFPDGAVEGYTRHEDGRIKTFADRKGETLTYSYDAFGRLSHAVYYSHAWPTGGYKGTFYNYDGQVLSSVGDQLVGPPRIYSFSYDDRFRVLTQGYVNDTKIEYDYGTNPDQRIKSYTVRPPSGNSDRVTTVYYTYDSLARVSTIGFDPNIPEATISYNARGQYDEIEFANSMKRDYVYDDQGRLTAITTGHSTAGLIANYGYGYDYDYTTSTYTMLGQRVSMTSLGVAATKYKYDAAYQLIETVPPVGSYARWDYDAIGNRTLQTTPSTGTTTYEYYKNGTNPANSARLRRVGQGPILTYDANGNQSNDATWDIANRLMQHGSVTFEYDWAMRRTKRATVQYTYVGRNAVRVRDTVAGVLEDYIFGPGIDEPLVRRNAAGAKHYYVTDGLGSAVGVVDAAGGLHEERTWDAWGRVTGTHPTFGFTGREPGTSTLLYYRYRYYDPSAGRFISEDPLQRIVNEARSEGLARQPRHVPEYTYARNSPTMFTDPLGLEPYSPGDVKCVGECIDSWKDDTYKCLTAFTITQVACIAGFLLCETVTVTAGTPACLYGLAFCESLAAIQWYDCKANAKMSYLKCLKGCCPS
ncbi:MAG TPA: RHS repeat-associated core domain-containing protein [Thermoanaerobaculia bacterium]